MRTHLILGALCFLTFVMGVAVAQPGSQLPLALETDKSAAKDKEKDKSKDKDKDKDKKTPPSPVSDPFPFPQTNLNEFRTFYTPNMMGDKVGYFTRRTIIIPGLQTATITTITPRNNAAGLPDRPVITTTTVTTTVPQTRNAVVAVPGRGSFNIAENESPMPVDRVFTTWNFYSNVGLPGGGNTPITTTTQAAARTFVPGVGQVTTIVNTTTVTPGMPRVNLNREVFGFEKTFFDGSASIEVRAPLAQQQSGGIGGSGINDFGELTVIGKYALFQNRETGNVFSVGLAVTAPTGRALETIDGSIHDTLIQPFIGYIWSRDRFFFQAFHSVVFPTDNRDVTLLLNDVGMGYQVYRGQGNRFLTSITPFVETHIGTPLNHRNGDGPIVVPDTVVPTAGLHIGLFRNAVLTLGVGTPVTGPRLYPVESIMQFNWRF
jgi:hypothetical protein